MERGANAFEMDVRGVTPVGASVMMLDYSSDERANRYETVLAFLSAHNAHCVSIPLGWTPQHYAAYTGQPLHTSNCNARDKAGFTPLHYAALAGNVPHALYLIEHGAKVNARNIREETALHIAARFGHAELIAPLLSAGAEINALNLNQHTPLYHAIMQDFKEAADVLLRNHANFKYTPPNISTLLHLAAAHDRANVIEPLARYIKIDARDRLRQTPLHHAVRSGTLRTVAALHKANANTNPRDANGMTPL